MAAALLAAGCGNLGSDVAYTYDKRVAFLDKMSAEGIKYRGQLQKQQTVPDQAACTLGWRLLNPEIPDDDSGDMDNGTKQWRAEVQEAYTKSCMTGQTIPKPDPSGVGARSVVPFSSSGSAAR
jgi:hypothetical protein